MLDLGHGVTVVASRVPEGVVWVLLSYRVPREPSTPRIAIWRKLRRLGVAQIGDGLVALPADARTLEALDWLAGDVGEAGGTATLWQAQLVSRSAERELIAGLVAARASEYDDIAASAEAALRAAIAGPARGPQRVQTASVEADRRLRLLRRQLRQVQRRDFFPPPQRERAQQALRALADQLHGASAGSRRLSASGPPPLRGEAPAGGQVGAR